MTAIRRPAADHEWSHRAECMTVPVKLSRPGMAGREGSTRKPFPAITYRDR